MKKAFTPEQKQFSIKTFAAGFVLGIISAISIISSCTNTVVTNTENNKKSIIKHEKKISDLSNEKEKAMLDITELKKERENAIEKAKKNDVQDWKKYLEKESGEKIKQVDDSLVLSKPVLDTIGMKLIALDYCNKENTELKNVINIQDTIIKEHDSINKEHVLIQNALSNELNLEKSRKKKAVVKSFIFGAGAGLLAKFLLGFIHN